MSKQWLVFAGLLISFGVHAQTDTIFNQTDKNGLKQGYWKVRNPQGGLKYSACFKDNHPIGKMKRYYESGGLKADMNFSLNGMMARTKVYYEQGPKQAEGNYMGTQKDSVWTYFSFYTKQVTKRETYKNDKLDGFSWVYYPDGKVSEQREWVQGSPVNDWLRYYQNGTVFMKTSFTNGKRSGEFQINYMEGVPKWRGRYVNDLPEGKWINYNNKGEVLKTIEYKNGQPVNAEQLAKEEQAEFDKIERQKGSIAEPDETNFWPNGHIMEQ